MHSSGTLRSTAASKSKRQPADVSTARWLGESGCQSTCTTRRGPAGSGTWDDPPTVAKGDEGTWPSPAPPPPASRTAPPPPAASTAGGSSASHAGSGGTASGSGGTAPTVGESGRMRPSR
eukprot:scaffold2941_cov22-Tisochrysis_lutea.AAC.2